MESMATPDLEVDFDAMSMLPGFKQKATKEMRPLIDPLGDAPDSSYEGDAAKFT